MDKQLVIERDFDIPVAELWQWITDNQKLGKWYGKHFVDADGQRSVRMLQEQGQPVVPFKLCSYRFENYLEFEVEEGGQRMQYDLTFLPSARGSRLVLSQQLPEDLAAIFEKGWLFYFDCLEAAIHGRLLPVWSDDPV